MIRYISFSKSLLPFLLVLAFALSVESAYAQKKERKKKAKSSQSKKELSEEKITELDHYFLEGEKYFILKDYSKSKTYFERVLEINPYHATTHYKMGQIYNLTQQSDQALIYAKRAKELDPDNKFYYIELANIQTSLGELGQASETYSELVKRIPGTELYLFELAALQIYQKKYEDAIYSYELAQFHLGPMEEISLQKQQVYLKQNKLDLAIKEGYELIKLNPTEETYVMTLARIMISNDKLDEAERFLNEQIAANKNNEKLYILISEVYRKNGDNVKALEALKKPFASQTVEITAKIRTLAGYLGMLPNADLQQPLVELSEILVQTHPDSYQALAMTGDMYYNTGEREKARDYYLKAVTIDGSSFNIWQNILTLDMEMEDYQGAIDHSETAMETFPNQASLYYFSGTAFLIQKKYEEAIKSFNRGKAYAARDANMNSLFYGQIGDAYNSLGDHEKSDEAYEQALKSKPDNDHVLNNYSYFLSLRKEDLEKAKSMSAKLVEDYPESPTYLDTHAWVLYMMNDFEGAAKYLKEAIKYDPSAVIIEHYGDALFQLGKINEAVEQWKEARDLVEDTSTLDKKIADRQLYE
ncbi:MAG: tetratricopeptide repeat protein [Reichenbachiella sp.]